MLADLARAFAQLDDPAVRRVAWRGFGIAMVVLAALVAGLSVTLLQVDLVGWAWLDWTIDVLGGVAVLVLAILLFPAVAGIITSFFLDDVCTAVERRYYPGLPPPRSQGIAEGIGTALQFTGILLLANAVAFVVAYWIPVINAVVFYFVNGYLLGREYFEMVALRRVPPAEVRRLRRRHGTRLLMAGIVIALLLTVPILNLLTPIVATAFMVHVYARVAEVQLRR